MKYHYYYAQGIHDEWERKWKTTKEVDVVGEEKKGERVPRYLHFPCILPEETIREAQENSSQHEWQAFNSGKESLANSNRIPEFPTTKNDRHHWAGTISHCHHRDDPRERSLNFLGYLASLQYEFEEGGIRIIN